MNALCGFCWFTEAALKALAKAKEWDDQRLPCIGSTYRKVALDFESQATAAKACTCGQPSKKKPRIRRPVDVEQDIVPL